MAVAARDHQQIAHIDRRGFERDDYLVFGRRADIGNVDHLHDVSGIPECFDLDRLHDRFSQLCTIRYITRHSATSRLVRSTAPSDGGAACLRNRMRRYSQPIATSTSPKPMSDSARLSAPPAHP